MLDFIHTLLQWNVCLCVMHLTHISAMKSVLLINNDRLFITLNFCVA
jgi:hypothetical protein